MGKEFSQVLHKSSDINELSYLRNLSEMNGMKQRRGYANLTNDYMFKRVFGSEECKDILIAFLNRIVGNGDIEDVTFQNTEHLGPTADGKRAVFDIAVRTKSGEEYIIEMQLAQQEYFRDRSLFYASYPILNQAALAKEEFRKTHGDAGVFSWNFRLKPVRFISVVNFPMTHSLEWDESRYFSSYRLKEDESGELLLDKLQFIFLELARFDKEEKDLETYCDKWMYLFKNMSHLRERPKVFDENEFDRLFEMAELCNFTPDEYYNYQNSQKMIYDYENTIDFAKKQGRTEGLAEGLAEGLEKGLEKGREEGLAEGLERGRIEIARNLLSMGLSVEQIVSATGLTEEQVRLLIDEAN